MTPETLVVVVLLLVVKYTLEFADRTGPRRRRRRRQRGATRVIDFTTPAIAPADPAAAEAPANAPDATGDPFWDMVAARIATLPNAPDTAAGARD